MWAGPFTLGASQRLWQPHLASVGWGRGHHLWTVAAAGQLQGERTSSVSHSLGFWKHSKETLLSALGGHTDRSNPQEEGGRQPTDAGNGVPAFPSLSRAASAPGILEPPLGGKPVALGLSMEGAKDEAHPPARPAALRHAAPCGEHCAALGSKGPPGRAPKQGPAWIRWAH